jgi:RNase P/RNase MRP subunit POP5
VSKAPDPHWRYVALRLECPRPVSRRAVQNALTGAGRQHGVVDEWLPQLTRFGWPHAIVRMHHHQLAAAREWLPKVDFVVEGDKLPFSVATLSSSGTIKTLTDRLGLLAERGQKAGANGKPAPSGSGKSASRPTKPAQASPRPVKPEASVKAPRPADPAVRPPVRAPPSDGPAPAPGRRRK